MDSGSAKTSKTLLACALLAAITLAVFGQTCRHEFISLDDADYVYDNAVVAQGLTSHGVAWAFTHFYSGNWHPLTWLSHMLDCQLYGLHPGGHHLTNVLIHAAGAITLFLVLLRLTTPPEQGSSPGPTHPPIHQSTNPPPQAAWLCFFVAALFAVHPLRVESVAWVAERKDVLSGLLFMLTIWAYIRYAREVPSPAFADASSVAGPLRRVEATAGRPQSAPKAFGGSLKSGATRYYVVALAFFALGLMSKPMLVTTPFVLLLLDFWPLGGLAIDQSNNSSIQQPPSGSRINGSRHLAGHVSRIILEKLPFFALSLGCGILTLMAQRTAIHSGGEYSLPARLENALMSCVVYLGQSVWPARLAAFYPFPRNGTPLWEVVLAGVVLAGISTIAWRQRRSQPWLLFGWLWYLVMLLPVIGLIQAGGQAHADRYTYLPQIGLCVALAWWVAQWRVNPAVVCGLAAGVVATLMICAWRQTGYWQNGVSLWKRTIACTKNNDMAHYCLGHEFFKRGKVDDAMVEFQKALTVRPDYADAHNALGICLFQKGKPADAMAQYEQALAVQPGFAAAHNGLGVCLYHQGKLNEAITQYQQALKLEPSYAQARNNLGNSLFQLGQANAAKEQYEKAIESQPGLAEARNNLGLCFFQLGRTDEAAAQYQAALKIKPDYIEARDNLGNLYFRLGRMTEALEQYQQALAVQPNSAAPRFNIGAVLFQMGKLDEAIDQFRKALELQPDLAAAHDSLGMALLQKGDEAGAIRELQKVLNLTPNDPKASYKLAWLLSTCTNAKLRDGRRALELAQKAGARSGGQGPIGLETLAAAYAELGRFQDARSQAQKAIELATAARQQGLVDQLTRELRRYEAGRPLHP